MKTIQLIFSWLVILCMGFIINSCKLIDKANMKYHDLAYSQAIPIYKKVLAKDSTNFDAWSKFGDCYKANNQTLLAEECYAKVAQSPNSKNIIKLNYAEMLMGNQKYQEALNWMTLYSKNEAEDQRAKDRLAGLNHIESFFTEKDNYKIKKLNINTSEADFGPAFYKEGIVFTSSGYDSKSKTGKHSWTGKKYYSLFYAIGKDTTFKAPVTFLEGIEGKYNNSSLCFNRQGTEMILTRNSTDKKNRERDEGLVFKLKLYFSNLVNGKWSEVVPFQYNSDEYSCAHAALNKDGSKLYFSSDMPGTYGGMDLWVSNRTSNGWDIPKNLGSTINTLGNEVFPSVADNGTVYFSSNGHEGIGGLDLYSTIDSAQGFSRPINLGAPFNSSDDDFGLIYDSTQTKGYFSSNRTHQGYNDDIFCIQKFSVKLKGLVADKNTNQLLAAANIRIVQDDVDAANKKTDIDGSFTSNLLPNKNYLIITEKEKYQPDTLRLLASEIKSSGDSMTVQIGLNNNIAIIGKITNEAVGSSIENSPVLLIDRDRNDTLKTSSDKEGNYKFDKLRRDTRYRIFAEGTLCDSKTIDTSTNSISGNNTLHIDLALYCLTANMILKNIYYDLDKANIRPDAAKELDKLVALLKKYPSIKIELGSHTDCRASVAYNLGLSKRRAEAAVYYLEKNGISRRRLIAIGYGESKPVNKCECEGDQFVVCTEEEHQLNRRTEIKIISIE